MPCDLCEQEPCTCPRTRAGASTRPYYYQPCATPGCTVMIGARVGSAIDPPTCRWCQAGTAYYAVGR